MLLVRAWIADANALRALALASGSAEERSGCGGEGVEADMIRKIPAEG